jgi:hypothetical protein
VSVHPNTHSIGGIALDLEDASRVVTLVKGVDDSAPIRSGLEDKAQQDGQWDAPSFYSGRPIEVQGVCEESDPATAQALTDSLRALSKSLTLFTVASDAKGVRNATVRVQTFEPVWLDDAAFTYTLTCNAPDPLLYGPAVFAQTTLAASAGGTGRVWPRVWPRDWGVPPGVTPGAITLPNAGTASYFPQVRIDGPVSNPVVSLVETGDWVRYSGSIGAGQHVDINWGTPRRVTIGDNPVTVRQRVTYSGNFLAVPVGGADMTWTADSFGDGHSLSAWAYEGAWE